MPTLKELGVTVENYMWVGFVAPKKTPSAVVERLREIMGKVVKDKAFIDSIEKLGGEVNYLNGEELARFWEKETKDNGRLLHEFKKEGVVIKN